MATINKTKSQTYNFLSENKNIEDIKKQANIEIRKKRRHGGKTFKLIVINNTNNQIINDDLSENEIFYDTYDTVDDLNDILAEKILKLQTTIQKQTQEIQQLKKENEKLKQSNINFDKFKYNALTIYDEKQRKKKY
ncbi:hypothetical protein [Spiroplasma endosymbiont of Acasis viretata]|uniref:hypothetical protein n=1 Tax=Spiroplasma endosymbiont of Acasis viretata TaxID=3066306 RepID=UPI00313E3F52